MQCHSEEYKRICISEKLKNYNNALPFDPSSARHAGADTSDKEPFSIVEFRNRLVRFVVVDDQVKSGRVHFYYRRADFGT